MLCFNIIHRQGRYGIQKIRYPFIDQDLDFVAFNDLIAAIFQLIQSQSQPGTASTKT